MKKLTEREALDRIRSTAAHGMPKLINLDAIDRILAEVEPAPAVSIGGQGWVPVAERLPAERCVVLVCQQEDDGPHVFTARFTPEWYYDAEDGGGQAGSHPAKFHDCRQSMVTHWMPLPSPPAP